MDFNSASNTNIFKVAVQTCLQKMSEAGTQKTGEEELIMVLE